MAKPYEHAKSSAQKWGGQPEDYLDIHNWFDETKSHMADVRHRAIRHHSEGIFLCEKIFGTNIKNSDGRLVSVRNIGEQHVLEDFGGVFIPSIKDYLQNMSIQPWMMGTNWPNNSVDRTFDGNIDGYREKIEFSEKHGYHAILHVDGTIPAYRGGQNDLTPSKESLDFLKFISVASD